MSDPMGCEDCPADAKIANMECFTVILIHAAWIKIALSV